jgi:fucose permease
LLRTTRLLKAIVLTFCIILAFSMYIISGILINLLVQHFTGSVDAGALIMLAFLCGCPIAALIYAILPAD